MRSNRIIFITNDKYDSPPTRPLVRIIIVRSPQRWLTRPSRQLISIIEPACKEGPRKTRFELFSIYFHSETYRRQSIFPPVKLSSFFFEISSQ